jgi:hypothetical protein
MLRLARLGVRVGLLSLLAVGTSGCCRGRASSQVASEVQNRLRSDTRMQMARVQVLATSGVVTLSGYVISSEQRATTVQDAAQIKGVRVVIDNLRIVEPSPPAVAMQKPSAAVVQSVARHLRHRASPSNLKVDAQAVKTAPAAERPPVVQTPVAQTMQQPIAVASAAGSVTSPAAATLSTTPDRHALASGTPNAGSGVVPVSDPVAPFSGRPVAPAEPERVTVPYGTEFVVRLTESLSSELNEKGDTFLASLASPVMIGDRVVIPAEAGVEGKVIEVQSAGRFSGRPKLAVAMTRLSYNGKIYELRSSQYSKQGASRDARTVAAIGGGAGVGAIIGAILGGGRGAAIGSVIGAGAGTGAQAATKAPQVALPAETVLNFRLQTPLSVVPASALQRAQNSGSGSPQDPFSSDEDRPVLKRRPGSPPPEPEAHEVTPDSEHK